MNKTNQALTWERYNKLIEVSQFHAPASTWIKSDKILNIYTGELLSGNIALYEDRIAYVGNKDPMVDKETVVIDAFEYTLVPGYIEPHSHPFQIYNPLTLMDFALSRGTTVLVHDNLYLYLHMGPEAWKRFMADTSAFPVKNYWWARLDPQTISTAYQPLFSQEVIGDLLSNPMVLQAGELTGWKDMLDSVGDYRERMFIARQSGKRIETHNPGASVETLNAMIAAGATCCHESITTEEVLRRLRLGLYASLRYSSIRPDLPQLLKGLLEASQEIHLPWNRLLMTTDGSPPFYFDKGFTDGLIQIALDAGVPAIEAYRMASLNSAVYYGLEQEVGAIAPGRIADILFLRDLDHPTPCKVMANGQWTHQQPLTERVSIDWASYKLVAWPKKNWRPHADWFRIQAHLDPFPVAKMLNAVILQRKDESLPIKDETIQLTEEQKNYVYVSLIDREGRWVTNGVVGGFGNVDALASTYSISGDLLVIGRDPDLMAKAAQRILDIGGGICLFHGQEQCFELSLPLLGGMSEKRMNELIPLTRELVEHLRVCGYRHEDPIYSILFFSATHLPLLRWTQDGVVNVKTGEVVLASRPLYGNEME